MICFLIILLSFLLDGILTIFLPFMPNDLSVFTPLFTVVSIFVVYPFYYKHTQKYYIHMFLLGAVYDLSYTNLLFWNAILFLAIAFLSNILYKNIEIDFIKMVFLITAIIAIYESLNAIIIVVFQLVPITFADVLYKILHTLLLNIFYAEFLYLLILKIPNKYKKISIN